MRDFILTVNYDHSLKQMIEAGEYDWTDMDFVSSRFPIVGTGVRKFEANVFHFGCSVSSEMAVKAINILGWKPGKIEHLLAYGGKHPVDQLKFPIVAIGSVAEVFLGYAAPCLRSSGPAMRSLTLPRVTNSNWANWYRFLAVREMYTPKAHCVECRCKNS